MGSEILLTIEDQALVGLLDSGTSGSLLKEEIAKDLELEIQEVEKKAWTTEVGKFSTNKRAFADKIKLPQFTSRRELQFVFNVHDNQKSKYEVILGRDFTQRFGIDLLNSTQEF